MDDGSQTNSTPGSGTSKQPGAAGAGSADPRADLAAGKRKAKELAAEATERAKREAETRKEGAAGQVDEVARAVERAAEELGGNPSLSRYASDLAGSMHGIAGRLRDRSIDDLAEDVRQLARSNPTLFVIGSIGVGLALSRFMKASPRRPHGADATATTATATAGTDEAATAGEAEFSGGYTTTPDPIPGAVSSGAYVPPTGTSTNPYSEPALGRTSADPRGRPDTLRGTEH
jgi:hypothetical protein